jgi:NAD(P)-dependent dehydrogenase (short-subunit alcohol dehydrogenase family)
MQGKTVIITGADGGIGREITKAIADKGAAIMMACIDKTAAIPVCESIKQETGNQNIEVMQIDLASLGSIREFTTEFKMNHQYLHLLINNAGIFAMKRHETTDGFESTMGINYLGPFLLTNLLLPIIVKTPQARIVNVSSNSHYQGKLDLGDLHSEKKYAGNIAYALSKRALVFFTQELAERLKDTGITVNALHPGHAATNIWVLWPGKWYQALFTKIINKFMLSPKEGAAASIYLATSDEVNGLTGKYFSKMKRKDPAPQCRDTQMQKDLWNLSEKLTGLVFNWDKFDFGESVVRDRPSFQVQNLRLVSRVGPDSKQINQIVFGLVQRVGVVVRGGKFVRYYDPEH